MKPALISKSLVVVIFSILLSGGSGLISLRAATPNVILVMCDDLGWGDLKSFHPDTLIATPHLDEMARHSLQFNRFYSAAPVCSPTRGSCLTGRHPFRYGIYFANTGHMKPEELTLPEILKSRGYATGHFGKWHLGTLTTEVKDANRGKPGNTKDFSPPAQHGYETSFVTESKVPTYDPMWSPKKGGKSGWDYIQDKSQAVAYGTRYWDQDGREVKEGLEGDDSRIIMDRAIPFIQGAVERGKPFFASIWFHAPHLPVVAGPDHVAPYKQYGVHERNYYGCVAALDEQVGRLRRTLKELGVSKDTMLWFCSDNGPEGKDGDPGLAGGLRGRKRSLYEGGVRVPGLLEWPAQIASPRVTDSPAVTSDYLPTVLDALGLALPNRPLDGQSLLPLIQGKVTDRNKPIGFISGKQKAWHDGRFKLISQDDGRAWELYDLVADRSESKDLAQARPEQAKALREAFEAWLISVKASDQGEDYKPVSGALPIPGKKAR